MSVKVRVFFTASVNVLSICHPVFFVKKLPRLVNTHKLLIVSTTCKLITNYVTTDVSAFMRVINVYNHF